MAERLRKTEAGSHHGWGSPVLATDPLREPLPSIADAIRAGELAAQESDNTRTFLLEKRYKEALRGVDLSPYVALIGSRMTMPNVSFRLIASRLEEDGGQQLVQPVGTPRRRQGALVGDDGSETDFQIEYTVTELRGEPFIFPVKYEQDIKPFEGVAQRASGGGLYGDYVIRFKEGEIDQVRTNLIPCSAEQDNDTSTNTFLKRFLNGEENAGYFYLNFSNLTTDPKLSIQIRNGMQRHRLCEYEFGENVDHKEDMLEGHASANNFDPGNLNFYTFLDMLEESVNLVPTI